MKNVNDIPFRKDEYGTVFYIVTNGGTEVYRPDELGFVRAHGVTLKLSQDKSSDVLHFNIKVNAEKDTDFIACGLRTGIDCYMQSYPSWNNKFFPTALRCEKNGFWGCCMSPLGDMIAIASPSEITSWKNEYNAKRDVGHRIYTFSVEFVQRDKVPARHIVRKGWRGGESAEYDLYMGFVKDKKDLYRFVKEYADISVQPPAVYNLEKRETDLSYGRHIVSGKNEAEASVYVRNDWMYYLDAARKNAERMQQKPGTHVESWYGFFTMAAYAAATGDKEYAKELQLRFEDFYQKLTYVNWLGKRRMKRKTLPHRLQNVSGMISLLADLYEVSHNEKYLDDAYDFARWLMHLQAIDGSYRSHGIHYTCVIYPAKSMLELALVARKAGRINQAEKYYKSARRAIKDLLRRMDNIGTEGEMTFEDGMITCEALQLAYLATMTQGEERKALTEAAIKILEKHRCLEQKIIPDCRTYGATLRFWEARYDINYNANMLNTPHGWTSWKTYATYYLYLLTQNPEYLEDTRDTMGACIQTIDENGVLRWAFVPDPCVRVTRAAYREEGKVVPEETVVSEEYLPMVSDWYRQPEDSLPMQYIRNFSKPETWNKEYGGSCDNDVHEHFKCLYETLFGKAFIHIKDDKSVITVNAYKKDGAYYTDDVFVHTFIVRTPEDITLKLSDTDVSLKKGIWAVDATSGEVREPFEEPWNV